MHRIVKADLFRYGGLTGIGGFIRGLRFPGFRYMYCLRRMANSKRYSPVWILFAVMKRRYSFKYGYQIPAGTKIGAGFYIGHRGAVVINERAIIGENCNIANGVTIGQTNRGKLKGTPTIGDNVWIGTGAVIVGNINIGPNVLIAPNAFVNVDVPPNSLVLGNPCKIVSKDNPCRDYIKNTYNE